MCVYIVWLAMKLVVAKFCRAKNCEGAKCVRSENAMQFSHHQEPAAV